MIVGVFFWSKMLYYRRNRVEGGTSMQLQARANKLAAGEQLLVIQVVPLRIR